MNVSGNRIDSVKELRCMSRMRQLNLSNNKLKDMKDLADTIGRHRYNLERKIKDIALAKMPMVT